MKDSDLNRIKKEVEDCFEYSEFTLSVENNKYDSNYCSGVLKYQFSPHTPSHEYDMEFRLNKDSDEVEFCQYEDVYETVSAESLFTYMWFVEIRRSEERA